MLRLATLLLYIVATLAKLLGPGGLRSVVAESCLIRQQLIVAKRAQCRTPKLKAWDRIVMGVCSLLVNPRRALRLCIRVQPATLLRFHQALVARKYKILFGSNSRRRPGPHGPAKELIDAVLDIKRRNPSYGIQRIANMCRTILGVETNKHVIRRILEKHYKPNPAGDGPSWLTTLGHAKDSLWSMDLFRCESLLLQTHWVLVVMDQYSRRIIGFGVHAGAVDGAALCRMFNCAIFGVVGLPRYLSLDNDPLYTFAQWRANLRVLEIDRVHSIPFVPTSHPFVERLIGSIRREFLDQCFFWNAADLEGKLESYREYFNEGRVHDGIQGEFPGGNGSDDGAEMIDISRYGWRSFCRGKYQTPIAA
jgi:putative transposase